MSCDVVERGLGTAGESKFIHIQYIYNIYIQCMYVLVDEDENFLGYDPSELVVSHFIR